MDEIFEQGQMPVATQSDTAEVPLHAVPEKWTKARVVHAFAEKHVPGFRGGVTRKSLAVLVWPWSGSIRYGLNTVGSAVERLPQDILGPWRMLAEVARRRDAEWQAWTPAERVSVMRQSTMWFCVALAVIAASAVLPDALLPVPSVLLFALWYSRSHWDVVRAALGMPQLSERTNTEESA